MKYYVNHLQFFYFGNLKIGLCVPTGCSADDVKEISNYIAGNMEMYASVDYCDYEGKYEVFTPRLIFAVCILSFLGFLSFVGTIVEYCCKKRNIKLKNLGVRLLVSFSAISNFPKLIDTNISENMLSCLFGIRCLSLFHVILEHEYVIINHANMLVHMFRSKETLNSFFFHIILNGFLTIDVFFFMGGLVNCYSRMKMKENSKNASRLQLIMHRLWRLYPAIILTTFVFPYIFDQAHGPRRIFAKEFFDNCDKNWWKNLIFMNVFFDQRTEVCMPQTWYISADFHLFIISLFTIPILFRNVKKGIILHVGIVFLGVASASVWAWHKNSWPTSLVLRPFEKKVEELWNAYSTPFPHIAPYFTGILVGYFLHMRKELKIPKDIQVIGWIVASSFFLSMLFLPIIWNRGAAYTVVESALYFGCSRLVYVLGVAWMVICCVTGHGGIINYILSLKIWIPLARLSFMAYLVSPAIQLYYGGNLHLAYDNHNMIFIWRHFGDIVASFLVSLVLVLIGESPFIRIEKIIFGKIANQKTEQDAKGNDNSVFKYNCGSDNVLQNNFKNVSDIEKL